MKSIKESLVNTVKLSEMINEKRVDEGLKDIFNAVKDKFKQAYQYLKGIVVKVGTYFLPVDESGEVRPAISPLTAGQAYKEGYINSNSTCVVLGGQASKIVGLNTSVNDAKKLYGAGNSVAYWKKNLKIIESLNESTINEVRLANQDPEAKYNVVADDTTLRKLIKMRIKNPKLARLMIWGAPGIGKTAILEAVAAETAAELKKDYHLIIKTLSEETPDNFVLPAYTGEGDQKKATDVPKTWMPVYKPTGDAAQDAKLDADCGSGLLFIDELSRATPQVLNVILPLINEGRFSGYKLGSGWTIICASNRAEDELAGQTDLGSALSNRFAHIYYEPTVHTWKKWAQTQNFISPLLIQWLSMPESENMSGGKFFYMDPNENADADPTRLMCTPRSWTNAMRELAEYSNTGKLEGFSIFDPDVKPYIGMALNCHVPKQAVDSFLAFLEVIEQIGDFDHVVHDIWNNGGASFKLDKRNLSKIIIPLAQLVVSSHSDSLPTEEEFKNLCKWLVSTGSDQLTSSVLDVFLYVFGGMINNAVMRGNMLVIREIVKKGMKEVSLTQWKSQYKPFCEKWGVDFDNIPNYIDGQLLLAKKFGEAFINAKIDGKDALG